MHGWQAFRYFSPFLGHLPCTYPRLADGRPIWNTSSFSCPHFKITQGCILHLLPQHNQARLNLRLRLDYSKGHQCPKSTLSQISSQVPLFNAGYLNPHWHLATLPFNPLYHFICTAKSNFQTLHETLSSTHLEPKQWEILPSPQTFN